MKNLGDFKPVLKQFSKLERENGSPHLNVYGLAFSIEPGFICQLREPDLMAAAVLECTFC